MIDAIRWKTWAGSSIYHSASGSNIHVLQNWRYRWLKFEGNAIQTLINYHHPEKPGLEYIEILTMACQINPASTCLLGLGGAGVAHRLSASYQNISLTAIESNSEVIAICKRFFMVDTIKNLDIIHQDAQLHLQHSSDYYQHILVDLFDAYSFPAHCNNEAFFEQCKQRLLPDGILAVNLANKHEQWPILRTIQSVFGLNTVTIPIPHTQNVIVFAINSISIQNLLKLFTSQRMSLSWKPYWGHLSYF